MLFSVEEEEVFSVKEAAALKNEFVLILGELEEGGAENSKESARVEEEEEEEEDWTEEGGC